jgi:hypothetical protein
VIYGAGDGGELLARELFNNAALQRVPVAFVDDDPRKTGKLRHGSLGTSRRGSRRANPVLRRWLREAEGPPRGRIGPEAR